MMLLDILYCISKAKNTYFSNIIRAKINNPKILFSIINSVIQPLINIHQKSSIIFCEDFLNLSKRLLVNARRSLWWQLIHDGLTILPALLSGGFLNLLH